MGTSCSTAEAPTPRKRRVLMKRSLNDDTSASSHTVQRSPPHPLCLEEPSITRNPLDLNNSHVQPLCDPTTGERATLLSLATKEGHTNYSSTNNNNNDNNDNNTAKPVDLVCAVDESNAKTPDAEALPGGGSRTTVFCDSLLPCDSRADALHCEFANGGTKSASSFSAVTKRSSFSTSAFGTLVESVSTVAHQ